MVNAAVLKASWPHIAGNDNGAAVGLDMFIRYFTAHPEMRAVFGYSQDVAALRGNAKLAEHGRKVLAQVGIAISEIDNLDKMKATLHALGVRHKGFANGGIKGSYFPALGDALVDAMAARYGAVDKAAWKAGYAAISGALVAGLES